MHTKILKNNKTTQEICQDSSRSLAGRYKINDISLAISKEIGFFFFNVWFPSTLSTTENKGWVYCILDLALGTDESI